MQLKPKFADDRHRRSKKAAQSLNSLLMLKDTERSIRSLRDEDGSSMESSTSNKAFEFSRQDSPKDLQEACRHEVRQVFSPKTGV